MEDEKPAPPAGPARKPKRFVIPAVLFVVALLQVYWVYQRDFSTAWTYEGRVGAREAARGPL